MLTIRVLYSYICLIFLINKNLQSLVHLATYYCFHYLLRQVLDVFHIFLIIVQTLCLTVEKNKRTPLA